MATVTVRYFAALRERRGVDQESVEVPQGWTLKQLYLHLFPPGPEGSLTVAYARNHVLAKPEDAVEEGDEIAFLPPIGGG